MKVDRLGSYQDVFNVIVGWDEYGNPIYNTRCLFDKDGDSRTKAGLLYPKPLNSKDLHVNP